ncbi:MAG: ACT domain-containing protein [Planctomycetota bacterium]|jgi:(p)ppGpp synthase/HD superfamily hydrolase
MVELKGTSWQQRYGTPEIFTVRCKILDKPGMSAKLIEAFGQVDAHMGTINLVDLEDKYKIRDFQLYVKKRTTIEDLQKLIDKIEGIEVLSVREVLKFSASGTTLWRHTGADP